METVAQFLNRLASQGVKLSVEDGRLNCYAQKGALTNELKSGILAHKAELIALLENLQKKQGQATIVAPSKPIRFPLAAGQKGLYILQKLHPEMTAFNVPMCLIIRGDLDVQKLELAWSHVVERFPILKARIVEEDGSLHHDLSCSLPIVKEQVALDGEPLLAFLKERGKQPFDLNAGPLTRIELFTRNERERMLLLTVHHMIFDGVSVVSLLRTLFAIYEDLYKGKPVSVSRERASYEEFVAWEESMLAASEGQTHGEYWQQQLSGDLPTLELFADQPRSAAATYEGTTLIGPVPEDLSQTLREFARAQNLRPAALFLAAFQLLLHRYTNQDDIIVGMPVIVRPEQKFMAEVGYFMNMLPLRTRCNGAEKLSDFLRGVQRTMLDGVYHASYPFEHMLDKLQFKQAAKNPVFQVNYAFQNFVSDASFTPALQDVIEVEHVREIGPEGYSDFALEIFETEAAFRVHVKYNPALYAAQSVERFLEHYTALLRSMAEDGDLPLREYSIVSEREKHRLLVEFNDTRAEYPQDKCIHDFFAERVAAAPDKIAASFGGEMLTYEELYDHTRDLALYLQSLGVRPDSIVGLCLERSLEMMLGIMGTVQAGGAYMPLDPDYPDDRLTYMLQDSRTTVVMTQEKFKSRVQALLPAGATIIVLDRDWPEVSARVAAMKSWGIALRREVQPHNLCYVIYTSGSTGRPKGVLNEHRGLVNRIHWMQKEYGLDATDIVLQKTPYSFDVSVWEFFWPMMVGASVVFAIPDGHKDVQYLERLIDERQVTTLHFVPSMLRAYLENAKRTCDSVKRIFASGEALDKQSADGYRAKFPNAVLHNLYGPTEAAIDVTYFDCSQVDYPFVPIGKPIDNIQLYVLGPQNQLQPVGIPGELHIAGDGLARGYLNRPELTEEKFVANPFTPGARMYKTGDLARWMDDGNIQYLGRIDTQVKIRGFRIELGEIEARLNQHLEIQDSAVIAKEQDGSKQLVAFYRAKESTAERLVQVSGEELRTWLAETLPEYMVPAAFVSIAAIPLSSNGKVDRRALSRLDVAMTSAQAYVAPRNETEAQLAGIWAEVLNVAPEKIGVNDNFFELGGHSLRAAQLISRIRTQLGADVPLKAFFEAGSVARLARVIAGAEQNDIPPIRPVDRSRYERLPLSFAQERLWFINELDPDNAGYNLPGAVTIRGELDADQLEQAFNLIIARHENLRTVFPSEEGRPYQRILDRLDFKVQRVDLTQHDAATRAGMAKQLCEMDATTPFDLANGPLIRCMVIRLADDEHIVMLNLHHIVSDAWSHGVLIKELGLVMEALRQGSRPELPALPIQYADYSVWQREWLDEGGVLAGQLAYWREKLAGVPESLDLPSDFPRPSVQSFAGTTHSFVLDGGVTAKLRKIAEQQGGTLYMVLLAAFNALLHRYTGQTDICVGSPIANRQYGETEGVIGMFVNTLALRTEVGADDTFAALLAKVKATCLEAYEHQDAPFEKVIDSLHLQRNLAVNPLFQVMLILQNVDLSAVDPRMQRYPLHSGISKFDLSIEFIETAEGLAATIEYNTALYKRQTIERMAGHFSALCAAITATPAVKVRDIDYIGETEKQRLLAEFNATHADYPAEPTLHQLFVDQVARHASDVAVVCGGDELTYQQLYARSNDLALYLQSQGVGPDRLVGVCMERSLDMIVAMLGILQAGGAYVPLDPNHPEERLAYMVRDSRAAIVLTQDSLWGKLSAVIPDDTRLIALDRQRAEIDARVAELDAANVALQQQVGPHHLAYVIYTSGSTGQPKGVAIEHHSPVTLIYWAQDVYSREELSGVLAATSICFDLSVYEIFLTLASGGTIILVQNALGLVQLANKPRVTLINTVPSAMEELVRLNAVPDSVMTVNLAGEPLPARLVDRIYETTNVAKVYDLYGPSEDTTYSTYVLRRKNGPQTIGRPIANTQVYILDRNQQIQPIGVPGELHIAGDGLCRGYLHRPELTQEKFVANPFEPGTRMYKTGDLARWMDDGTLQYLGRIDNQVKIRGFRIELGEIEARLNEHPAIQDAVVIAQGQGADRQLVAFYRAKESTPDHLVQVPYDDLRAHLLKTLPDYMVPPAFVSLAAIPLNPNGKVDRRALSRIDVSIAAAGQEYVAPRNDVERQLAAIWADVLNRAPETIGVNDSFFELGGHSLLATQLIAKIRTQLAIELPLKALFEESTIAQLAQRIAGTATSDDPAILPVDRTKFERLPLSFAQERLWFLNELEPQSAGYNVPGAVTIEGDLDVDQLERAFQLVIDRHETLRTVFPSENGQARQRILDQLAFTLERIDLRNDDARDEKARALCQQDAATPFDLANGPLLRGKAIRIGDRKHILLLNMHHIISDGWSIGVLIKELAAIMSAFREGRAPELPALPIQYADYSVWQRQWLEEGGVLERQLEYWQKKLAGAPETLDLPTDFPRPSIQSFAGATSGFTLDAALTAQLERVAEERGGTLYMVLLAALKALLHRYTGQTDLCIGSPIANRQHSETESLIGMFVNTLALRDEVEGNDTFEALLARVRSTCLEAYEHQDAPFEKVIEALRIPRNLATTPLFQVMLVLQNMDMGAPDAAVRPYAVDSGISKFDLTLAFTQTPEGLAGTIEYSTALYRERTIARMAEHFTALCRAIAAAPATAIRELDYLGADEEHTLLIDFNATRADYPQDRLLHDFFVEHASRRPDDVAVVCGATEWTYAQLHARSRDLALYLQSLGVGPDGLVGVCMERSLDMLTAMLGILQAGGAYVPLDPNHPEDRLAYMVRDSRAAIVLTQESLLEKLSAVIPSESRLIAVDRERDAMASRVAELHAANVVLKHEAGPQHLAYVIYTSGSTGQPKGVAIEHHSPATLVHWGLDVYSRDELAGVLAATSICFDLSVYEIFLTLASGGTIFLVPNALGLVDLAHKERVTLINTVPSAIEELVRMNAIPASVRTINLAGEPLPARLVDRIYETTAAEKVYDLYGPSEDTTYSTYVLREKNGPQTIGRPIANTQVYILDAHNQIQPIGIPGELHIAGDGLCRGYLHRPELTREKFVANPFEPGTRMYKTGDLARWMEDGTLQYLGRIDNQVKIRGFRIELGEIEARLNEHAEVQDAVVIAQGQGAERQLVAFYRAASTTSDEIVQLPHDELRAHLLKTLPDYMVPAAFVSLAAIPLNPNGKVDRRALSRIDVTVAAGRERVAPRNETERQLTALWSEVLHVTPEVIGVHDSFFELGGHSLLATRLVSKIRSAMNVDLPLKTLFERSSVAQLAEVIAAAQKSEIPPIRPFDRTEIERLPLSFAQERLWFIHQLEPDNPAYNLPAAVTVRGELDADRLDEAFNRIIERHESLRTIFPTDDDGKARQVVLDRLAFTLERTDLSGDDARHAKAEELCRRDAAAPFDLATGPLIRGKVIRLADDEHILMLNLHHIVSDGWSSGILIRELGAVLNALQEGREPELAPLPIQYADYSVWQRQWLEEGGALDEQLAYWQSKLAGAPESLDLPLDHARPAVQNVAGATYAFDLDAQLTRALKQLAEEKGGTLYMALLAAFKVLLHRYSGQNDICVGTPIANRRYAETEGLIGMFVNTLALRTEVEGEDSFTAVLEKVKATCLEAYEHQDAPFEKVVDALRLQRSLTINPLFQVMLILQNADMGTLDERLRLYPLDSGISKFDLTFDLTESAEGLSGSIRYRTSLYERETIERMVRHFVVLCGTLVSDPSARVDEVQYLDESERQRLLVDYNGAPVDFARERCVHELFAEQVAIDGDRTAVVFGDEQLTYRELAERSRTLAAYLQSHGVVPDARVGLFTERSLEMVVGMFAILQAGGAYVPLDPDYPADRLQYMLEDSAPAIVLTHERLKSRLPRTSVPVVALDSEWSAIEQYARTNGDRITAATTPEHLAYVIYTSGSTGVPKGVMVRHGGVVNLVTALEQAVYQRRPDWTRVSVNASFSFDSSVKQFVQLLAGRTLVLVPQDVRLDANALVQFISEQHIDVFDCTPSQLVALLAAGLFDGTRRVPKAFLIGGEAIDTKLWRTLSERRDVAFFNVYGPAECTVDATVARIASEDTVPHIGRPVANARIYIVDGRGEPVPEGVVGEICIGGAGVARGYLNRPELTAERFVADRFSANPDARLYKTGDLGRWRAGGTIEFAGRNDHQVKIRGQRLELGEIETQLATHPGVREAVVIAREDDGEKRLVAYVTGEELRADDLRAHLLARLPQYMVPAAFVQLDALPLTPNRKIDRKALPMPDAFAFARKEYEAPRGAIEETLAAIWQELLRVERVGRNDDFFELGGHSLSAVQLMAKINRHFQQMLPLAVLFTAPSIAALAQLIAAKETPAAKIVVPIHAHGNGAPVFAVPGAGGNVLSLRPLGKAIGDARRLFALQAVGLDGNAAPFESVEQTAKANVAAIKSIQPEGPYSLIGHSYGGVVAHEMARMLLEQGDDVASLVLLDSIAPAVIQNNPAHDDATALIEACKAVGNLNGRTPVLDADELRRTPLDENIRMIVGLLNERGVEVNAEQFAAFYRVYRANVQCYRSHVPSVLPRDIDVSLYRAKHTGATLPDDYGWNALLRSPIRVYDVAADHYSILDKVRLLSSAAELEPVI